MTKFRDNENVLFVLTEEIYSGRVYSVAVFDDLNNLFNQIGIPENRWDVLYTDSKGLIKYHYKKNGSDIEYSIEMVKPNNLRLQLREH